MEIKMKKILFACTFMLLTFVISANIAVAGNKGPFQWPVVKVKDGDTFQVNPDWLPEGLTLSIRVKGVDTPEKGFRAKCASEDKHGKAATEFTTLLLKSSTKRQIVLMDWDKYGGRVLGDVVLDGKSLRALLIQNGYAREYYGEAKTSWCN